MTPKQFHQLPECFQEKIKADEELADFKLTQVLDFKAGRHLVLNQLTQRLRCKAFVKRSLTGGSNAA